ncbi:SlyX family protein [Nitrincola alkalilacustris]|uniref:SlyX family protein n=1 Tax=Nitrincola alkalilacustris TaxID=1571224 RepID=UPI00124E49C4|nr:SlyX family protein [Nitrincola alkalilacustris]
MTTEKTIEELETRIAFQEDAIDKISDVVARQERELEKLWLMVQHLSQQLKQLDNGEIDNDSEHQPPPHY